VECSTRSLRKAIFDFSLVDVKVPYDPSSEFTSTLELFKDTFIWYELAELTLTINVPNRSEIRGFQMFTVTGSDSQTTFQVYFRFIFGALHAFAFYRLFVVRDIKRFMFWPIEHQFTLILAGISVFSTNPLYFCHAAHPLRIFVILHCLFTPLYRTAVYVVSLALLQNVEHPTFIAELLFGCAVFVAEFLSVFRPLLREMIRPGKARDISIGEVDRVGAGIAFAFTAWVMWRIVAVLRGCDPTYGIRAMAYSAAAAAVAVAATVTAVGNLSGRFDTDLDTVVWLTVENGFSLLMLHLHWPYDSEKERTYGDAFGSLDDGSMLESSTESSTES
jgi:hypothetical protein